MKDDTIVVDGIKIHYIIAGKEGGSTVLLIHGLGNAVNIWYELLESELSNKVKLIAVDLPGFGHSDKPKDFSYKIDAQALIIKKFLEELSLEVDYLVGFSMGGTIAVYLASMLDKLKKLILIEPTLVKSDIGFSKTVAKSPKWIVGFVKFLICLFPQVFMSAFIFSKDKAKINILVDGIKCVTSNSFKKASIGLVQAAFTQEPYEKLKKLDVEIYYILGDNLEQSKHFSPPKDLFEIAKKEVIPHAKHCVMLDNFPKFYEVINKIIQQ